MMIRRLNPEATHFLNVDLDIYSRQDLGALVSALGKRVIVLDVGRIKRTHHAHLELAKTTKTADATIRGFCALIETLPKVERDLWNAAKVRDFNIGVQAGTHPYSSEFALAAETLKAAQELNARIVFTVYAPEELRAPRTLGTERSSDGTFTVTATRARGNVPSGPGPRPRSPRSRTGSHNEILVETA